MTDFDLFWEHYPWKKGKGYARKCFDKQKKIMPEASELITAINNQIRERKYLKEKNQFVPPWKNPSTWINQECWGDVCVLPHNQPQNIVKEYSINTLHRAYNILANLGRGKFEEFVKSVRMSSQDREAVINKYEGKFDVQKLMGGIG